MRRLQSLLVAGIFVCMPLVVCGHHAAQAQVTFAPQAPFSVGTTPSGLALGDLNGDGKLDLVVANRAANTLSIFLGKGDGTFSPHPTHPTIALNEPSALALGDLNGDGKLDLVVGYARDGVVWTFAIFLGNGDGTFTRQPDLNSPWLAISSVLLADVDGDGKLDIVVDAVALRSFGVFFGNGDGTFNPTPTEIYRGSSSSPFFQLADVNGDGQLDAVYRNMDNPAIAVFLGHGNGSFDAYPGVSSGAGLLGPGWTGITGYAIADVTGDGKPDVILSTRNIDTGESVVVVLRGNGDGTFTPVNTLTRTDQDQVVGAADLNGDGKADLILAGNGLLKVLAGNGDGTFGTETHFAAYAANGWLSSVVLGDVNGDGKLDIVANASDGTISVFLNTTLSEILVRNTVTGDLGVWYMGGAALAGYDYIGQGMDLTWAVVGVGDFNGDGHSDILLWNTATGDVAVWYMNGASWLGYDYINRGTDLSWRIVGVGDFNGDGKPDILVWHQVTGDLAVWYMNGPTRLGYDYINRGTDLNWRIVGVGDFNGDGKPDILLWHQVTGDLAVLYMNGPTRLGYDYINRGTDLNWRIVGVGDFNGDGKPDILLWNQVTGDVAVWYMDGATQLGCDYINRGTDLNWRIVGANP